MAHGTRPRYGAPSKYLHLHALSERSSVLGGADPVALPSDGTCTLSSEPSVASPQSAGLVADGSDAGAPPWPPAARRCVNPDALPTDVVQALRFCDGLLLMDDDELTVTVVLAKRCLDTGLPIGPANVHLFALTTAMLACKLQCDEPHTLAAIARHSSFSEEALSDAEWYVFGWLLDHSRLAVSPSEYAACAARLFRTCPPPIVPTSWLVGGPAAAPPPAPRQRGCARALSAPLAAARTGSSPKALRTLSTRFLESMGWKPPCACATPVAVVNEFV